MRILLLLLAFTACAHAQFNVTLALPRTTFMALEAIPASVTITNRTGSDAVLGGPGRGSWLSFEMTDVSGHPLAPIEVSAEDLVQIPAGGSVQRKVTVTDAFSPTEIGNYTLTARVMHAPSQQYFASNRARFNITDAKPLWEQTFGMPEGYKDVGRIRRYSILVLREAESSSLYFRLLDDKTGLRLQTYTLGQMSMVYDPQITIDRTNGLQILFLVMPKLYCHVVIKPDGTLVKRAYYREPDGNRPKLVVAQNGDVSISGGQYYNPSAPPAEKSKTSGKGVSERPPGL